MEACVCAIVYGGKARGRAGMLSLFIYTFSKNDGYLLWSESDYCITLHYPLSLRLERFTGRSCALYVFAQKDLETANDQRDHSDSFYLRELLAETGAWSGGEAEERIAWPLVRAVWGIDESGRAEFSSVWAPITGCVCEFVPQSER
jgi:hypothetical protein